MSHFATAALFRKRTGEKRNEKHHEKTSKIHAKSDGKSCRFRKSMADALFHAFWPILAQFLVKNELWDLPGRAREAPGPSRGRPRGPWGGSPAAPGGHFGGFWKFARRRDANCPILCGGRPKIAPCSSAAVRDVPRRLRNVLRGKGAVQKSQRFPKMHHIFEFSSEKCRFS